ncbi:actin depolymerizing protein [Microthyrium microscopicum]|uniref:Actin depolymerizing protein n=1 Tax=Microthyrium microscopicum TaxID=703497 RepID=A0A6A6UQS3_9PEZI|nr:actin depolymerizing protein [Microthyrium microscopicum]
MQSGISASVELHEAFKDLLATPSTRALLASINGETIVPKRTIPSTSDFYDDLSALATHLQPNEALYILIRAPNGSSTAPLTAVTYVPDTAPVRQKTLFASTRLTLARELGTEHFSETFFTTVAEELSAAGWKRHEKHVQADVPLTEEERNLADIRDAEASEIGGTGRRGAGYGPAGGKSMGSGEGVVDALKQLADGAGRFVTLKINASEEVVLADPSNPVVEGVSAENLASQIDASEPRYSYWAHEGGQILFFYTCPSSSKIRERMIYASSRRSAEVLCEKEAGIALAKKMEATDPSEITEKFIAEEFAPKQEQKAAFSKPKRPGRK